MCTLAQSQVLMAEFETFVQGQDILYTGTLEGT